MGHLGISWGASSIAHIVDLVNYMRDTQYLGESKTFKGGSGALR